MANPETKASEDLKLINPPLFDKISRLYVVLAARIRPESRTGPALSSLDDFCSLLLIIHSDAKDRSRIKVAGIEGGEVWFGFYPNVEEPAVEFIQKKSRGEFGIQVSRWGFASGSELLAYDELNLKRLFSGYSD